MNIDICDNYMNKLFNIKTEGNLFESYTEMWAEIINACFCSFLSLQNKENKDGFMKAFEEFIYLEKIYSFVQMVKVLYFMGLKYKNLYLQNKESILLRTTMYKERTNVFSYYVVKCILMNQYQSFLSWCNENNYSLLHFKKTNNNLLEYCKLIERNYKTTKMLENVKKTEYFLNNMSVMLKSKRNTSKVNKELQFLLMNARMSLCEIV